jgi:hypothetical protein
LSRSLGTQLPGSGRKVNQPCPVVRRFCMGFYILAPLSPYHIVKQWHGRAIPAHVGSSC